MTDPDNEKVLIGNLPQALFEAIKLALIRYSVGFVRIDNNNQGIDAVLLGSGTLIKIGSTHAILTAHHVLEVLPRTGRLGLLISATAEQPYTFDCQGFDYFEIARGIKESEGPDLGALILGPDIVTAIETKKVFYNLETRRTIALDSPPHIEDGVWIANGFIAEETITTLNRNEKALIK